MQYLKMALLPLSNHRFVLKISLLLIFWYLALFPGRLGYDYSLAIRMIQNGESTNWWTGTYFWFLRIATFYGKFIFIASLIGLISLAYSVWFFLKSALNNRRVLERTFLVVLFFPLLGPFGVTVTHDVFQTSGILIYLGLGLQVHSNALQVKSGVLHFILGSVYLITTQTGIYTVVTAVLISLFTRYRTKLLLPFLGVLMVSILGNVGISGSIIKHPTLNILLADLKCVTQHVEAEISRSEWQVLEEIAQREQWERPLSCSNPDALISSLGADKRELEFDEEILKTYFAIASKNPAIVLQAHLQRSLGALPPPFFQGPENQVDRNIKNPVGLGTNTALQLGPEILHPSIDEPSVAQKISLFKPLEVFAQTGIFLINQASWFWGWGGLWLYPILYFYLFGIGIRKISTLCLILFPTLLLHISYVAVGPGPLGRYYFSTILAGFSLSVAMLCKSLLPKGR
jgi:hypothetical protein